MPTESDKACGLSISDHFRPPRRQKRMPGEDGKLGRGGSVEQVVRPPPVSPPRRPLPPAPNLTPCPASPAAPPPLNLRFSSSSCGSHSHPSIQEAGRFLCVCVGGGEVSLAPFLAISSCPCLGRSTGFLEPRVVLPVEREGLAVIASVLVGFGCCRVAAIDRARR
jgi:hypothetical protein